MNKEINLNKWVNDRLNSLNKQVYWLKIRNHFWVTFLLIVNITTIAAATLALTFLFIRTPSDQLSLTGNISLIFTIISLIFIILIFFLQIFNKIYLTKMRDKIYQVSINRLKVEIVKFNHKIGEYAKKDAVKKLEEAVMKVEADVLTFQSIKSKLRQAFVSAAIGEK